MFLKVKRTKTSKYIKGFKRPKQDRMSRFFNKKGEILMIMAYGRFNSLSEASYLKMFSKDLNAYGLDEILVDWFFMFGPCGLLDYFKSKGQTMVSLYNELGEKGYKKFFINLKKNKPYLFYNKGGKK